ERCCQQRIENSYSEAFPFWHAVNPCLDSRAPDGQHISISPRAHRDAKRIEKEIEELSGLSLRRRTARVELEMQGRSGFVIVNNCPGIRQNCFTSIELGHDAAAAILPCGKDIEYRGMALFHVRNTIVVESPPRHFTIRAHWD